MDANDSPIRSYRFPLFATTVVVLLLSIVSFVVIMLYLDQDYAWTNDANIDGYRTEISSRATEKVVAIYYDEGDFVQQGQLIAELDSSVPSSKKREAEANVKAKEQLILVKEALVKKLGNDYIRAEEGIREKVISRQEFDHKLKDLEMAQAELDYAHADLALALRKFEVAEAELARYKVYAPHDGVIAKRWVWVGDVVSPGQSMFTQNRLDDVWVLANLEEGKVADVKIGSDVDIAIDAYPGYLFHGKVFTIKSSAASLFSLIPANNATGNYTKVSQRIPIKISITPPEELVKQKPLYLFPGMSAQVWISRQTMARVEQPE